MTIREAKRLIKVELSKSRYHHSVCVADAAARLARRYGVPVEKARLAGLLHDIMKERSSDEQLKMLSETAIIGSSDLRNVPPVLHAFAGAVYLKNIGIDDPDIINAVRHHSTGTPDMSVLEKIIYVADFIGRDRHFPEVPLYRRTARKNLNKTVEIMLYDTLERVKKKERPIFPLTQEAYEYIKKENLNDIS